MKEINKQVNTNTNMQQNGIMDEGMGGSKVRYSERSIQGLIGGWFGGWMDRWKYGWMDGWLEGQTD